VCRIIGHTLFEETVTSYPSIQLILTPFFRELTEEENKYSYFMQDSAMVHITNFSMTALEEVFGEWLITCRL
jgi:hypothetical protein